MRRKYYKAIILIEKLHRLFLDVLKNELRLLNIQDITNVQCSILYNIGEEEINVSALTEKGYYQGTNVSYNIRKMAENGYILQHQSNIDRRVCLVSLSEKGFDLSLKLDAIFERHAKELDDRIVENKVLEDLLESLTYVEKFLLKKYNIN